MMTEMLSDSAMLCSTLASLVRSCGSGDDLPMEIDMNFEHAGLVVVDFHDIPIQLRTGVLDLPTFIEEQGEW